MRIDRQNRILFRFYCFVKFHAQTCVAADRRQRVVKSVLLNALFLLREGLWSIPMRELSDYARHAIALQAPGSSDALASQASELKWELAIFLEDWEESELPIQRQEMERAIEIVYARQPEQRVQIHRLLRQQGLSYLEVARRLGVTIERVRLEVGIIQRALKKALARKDLLPESAEERRIMVCPPALSVVAGGKADRAKWAARQTKPWQWSPDGANG